MKLLSFVVPLLLATSLCPRPGSACTTILVGKELTLDGSVLHGHNEDMGHDTVGRLWSVAGATQNADSSLSVPYVKLPQVPRTLGYWAAGNVQGTAGLGTAEEVRPYDSVLVGLNERGVSMSCNWAHSREEAREGVGLRRYALRQLLLERATSARHSVQLLGEWIETHGQADWAGLIYHLADPAEAWVVETTTRHWVARRVKDDEIHVTANRFRIGTDFDLSSQGLVSYAVERGWHSSAEEPLDFAQTYGREALMHQSYDSRREDRARHLLQNKSGALTPQDLFAVLRDRYQGTEHYTAPQTIPVWRENLAEQPSLSRTISTNLAQSSFVAHLRSDSRPAIGAVMWLGLGVPSYIGYAPLYAGGTNPGIGLKGNGPEPQATIQAWGDGSAWQLFRRLQRLGDKDFDRHQPTVQASWAAHHALTLEHQRLLESRILSGPQQEGQAEQQLRAFSWSRLAGVLEHGTWLLQHLVACGESLSPARAAEEALSKGAESSAAGC